MPPGPALALLFAGCAADAPGGHAAPRTPVDDEVATLSGDVTWTVAYDEEAEAAGLVDCSYTRTYTLSEDRSAPWLCPDCDLHLVGSVEMSEPDAACYRTLTGVDPATEERFGWSGDVLRRAILPFAPLVEAGTVRVGDSTVDVGSDSGPVEASSGSVTITGAGTLDLGTAPGDPMHGLTPPVEYACGWPAPDPPPYEGDWLLDRGSTVPDGLFLDLCGEGWRLHDLAGVWAIVEVSAADCPPCQEMAAESTEGLQPLEDQGVDVTVVTLLAPSLSEPLSPSDPALVVSWNATFDAHGPVVGDRGWGFAVGASQWGYEITYPTWIVVDPSLEVVAFGEGYPGWEVIVEVILQ